jgi:hypothetical protein
MSSYKRLRVDDVLPERAAALRDNTWKAAIIKALPTNRVLIEALNPKPNKGNFLEGGLLLCIWLSLLPKRLFEP